MAQILGGGPPTNDAERAVIQHLRDRGPDDWVLWHNVEIPFRGDSREIDLIVVTQHAVVLIDVKGTRGQIEVHGNKWHPRGREPYYSPVAKLRSEARAFKGRLEERNRTLSRVWVDALVVLTAEDAALVDRNDSGEADAAHVAHLSSLIDTLQDISRVRAGSFRDLRPHRSAVTEAIAGVKRAVAGPLQFGHWEVVERLGGTDQVTEYRAVNTAAPHSGTVLLRVYQTDPFQPDEALRTAERRAISNAYTVLRQTPASPHIVGPVDFFHTDDESQFVLVLNDARGEALQLYLTDPRRALATDVKLRLIADILRGLARAHAARVIHRALTPSTVLVTRGERAMLTGFDYARPETPRAHTVLNRLADVLDPSYVAPECQARARAMSKKSDVYAAGVIAYQLLTGELPFATSADQFERRSVLPRRVLLDAGVSSGLADLLQRMCAREPDDRPTAGDALLLYNRVVGNDAPVPVADGPQVDYANLPNGHPLTQKLTIVSKCGSGRFSYVYRAHDRLGYEDRAVKIITGERESPIERLRQEFQLLRTLSHPNVVEVETADLLPDGTPYLVSEYLDGQDVQQLIKERSLGPADVRQLGIDVTQGLVYLHNLHPRAIYHCDIKPTNLMRTDRGCKIIDFNVSVTPEFTLSRAGGTARYAPPDTRSNGSPTEAELADRDVYGLGLSLYQLLTGEWPFRSTSPAVGEQAIPLNEQGRHGNLSDAFVQAIMKAIAPLRSERYQSAADFLAALESIEDVHERPAAPDLDTTVPAMPEGPNSFVTHLKTLYSQSTSSNTGTRGHDPYRLYVETKLDRKLIPHVLSGRLHLVIITGNAGDGKTAFLENLIEAAIKRGAREAEPRPNGADVKLPRGRWLRTNHDGSQDEGDQANDEVLLGFFAQYSGDDQVTDPGETRLIAINEGRLVDFLATYADRFGWLAETVRATLAGAAAPTGLAIINLNQRSVVADDDELNDVSIFDRLLQTMTKAQFWEACGSCVLVDKCYAPHNALSFAHPSAGPQITKRLKELYTLAHLRGRQHITLRDLRSALAFTLTSGRDCAEIRQLYQSGDVQAILDSFYFNGWAGAPGTKDRLLASLRELDIATVPDPPLDRKLDYAGPDLGQAVIIVDQRGRYDMDLLDKLFHQLTPATATTESQAAAHRAYVASARRRFYFESVDDRRSRRLLPYRSADRLLELLEHPGQSSEHLPEVVTALNRSEGLTDPHWLGRALALQVRRVAAGTVRSYRLFDVDRLSLAVDLGFRSPYLEQHPGGLVLSYRGEAGQVVRLDIKLDLFELLHRLAAGYMPGIAERQGLYLALTIFKNELSAAPYQEILLTTGGDDIRRITREEDGRLAMRSDRVGGSDDPA